MLQNCSLVENVLDTSCVAQIWYDLSILRMFTVVKCRGHTNFELRKRSEISGGGGELQILKYCETEKL